MNEDQTTASQNELPLLSTPRALVHFIDKTDQLEFLLDSLSGSSGAIAIDAERASGFKYSQRAYLIQLKAPNTNIFLLDPTSDKELCKSTGFESLRKLLAEREWILHAATQDLPCLAELGLAPGAIFDTELSARLAGEPRVGLGSLTENLLGFRLAKEHSAADWSTRPLPATWLNYAALDVDVLHELAQAIKNLLVNQGKLEWANQEFQSLLSFKPKPQREDRWRSITGLSKVRDQLSLEIARRLWDSREKLAQKIDVAPNRLVPDSAILAVSTEKPKSKPELANQKSFTGRASRSYLDTWWSAVEAANKATILPPVRADWVPGIPNHRNWAQKYPEADKRLRFAKSALIDLSQKLNLPVENLLTPEYLRNLCFTPPEEINEETVEKRLMDLGARPWQRQLTCSVITEAFNLALKSPDEPSAPAPQELDEHEAL